MTGENTDVKFYQNPTVYTTRERDQAVRLGNALHVLASVFGRSSAPGPDAMFLVETESQSLLREATESMAAQLHVPLIVADAEFGIDEVLGTSPGKIESTGDSLFRVIAKTQPGILVVEGVDHMRPNNLKIFNRLVEGKTLRTPDMDKPADLKDWVVVVSALKDADIDPDLKKKASATIDLNILVPKI